MKEGDFEFHDTHRNAVRSTKRLVAALTLKEGRVWYERAAE
jgi:hypothetical protein